MRSSPVRICLLKKSGKGKKDCHLAKEICKAKKRKKKAKRQREKQRDREEDRSYIIIYI